ncbi:hypothetical protein QCA50_019293 [Cerrena zonata]|uniref:Uncharacterized protein n=1 Tax=Cerrena zonata TaxID=2478898 RepID=A0AAW0FB80_9APHY
MQFVFKYLVLPAFAVLAITAAPIEGEGMAPHVQMGGIGINMKRSQMGNGGMIMDRAEMGMKNMNMGRAEMGDGRINMRAEMGNGMMD